MATGSSLLPVPLPLEIHDSQAAEKWKRFKYAQISYALETGLGSKTDRIEVTTLLTGIGEEAHEIFTTFTWKDAGDEGKTKKVLGKFNQYCQPRTNIPFERQHFNQCRQEPGETYDHYRMALLKLTEGCSFQTITPEEILCDKHVFGIKDQQA